MRTVAFVPIKLNSQRLPHKNILDIAGKPLCWHICNTLCEVDGIDEVFVYCSDDSVVNYLPGKVVFKKRSQELDADYVKGIDIYKSFLEEVNADTYVLAHTTSPFIKRATIEDALGKVLSGEYDSAFSAEKIQTFAWFEGSPINYNLKDVPRTQDLEPIWVETSGFFIFNRKLMRNENRRIGYNPYIKEVTGIEAIDIDEKKDFEMAEKLARIEGISYE